MNWEEYLEYAVRDAIREVLREGAKKPRPCHWIGEPIQMHDAKCVRHLQTANLIELGYEQGDEDALTHRRHQLVRAAMAYVIAMRN